MRRFLIVVLSLVLIFIISIYFLKQNHSLLTSGNVEIGDQTNHTNQSTEYLTDASPVPNNKESAANNDISSISSNVGILAKYTVVKELSNLQLEPTVREVTYQNFTQLFKGFLDYSTSKPNHAGYFLTTSKELVYFPLNQIRTLQEGERTQKIYSYQLPKSLSSDLDLYVLPYGSALIQDRKQKLFMSINLDVPIALYDPLGPATIQQTIKFSGESGDFNIITGYMTGDSYTAEISDKQNNVYEFNYTDLILSNIMHGGQWRTVGGYSKPNEQESYKNDVLIYQVDDQAHVLRKIDRSTNQEILQVDLTKLLIKGQVEKVMNDDDLIYLLVTDENKQNLYETNENLQKFVYSTASYSDGSNWNHIDDIWYYRDGNTYGAITIFDKQSKNAINFLQTYDWPEIK